MAAWCTFARCSKAFAIVTEPVFSNATYTKRAPELSYRAQGASTDQRAGAPLGAPHDGTPAAIFC